ncbi:hypothetical protein KCP70_25420 [Salmonella enterica subsp. enterica]|nr:hypothetical protein KCP70_25420 [Salmonella enterica subsp. enterica]
MFDPLKTGKSVDFDLNQTFAGWLAADTEVTKLTTFLPRSAVPGKDHKLCHILQR